MSANTTAAARTGRKKLAQGKERSDATLGHDFQNTSSPDGAKDLPNGWRVGQPATGLAFAAINSAKGIHRRIGMKPPFIILHSSFCLGCPSILQKAFQGELTPA
jgi:hypothetical protein